MTNQKRNPEYVTLKESKDLISRFKNKPRHAYFHLENHTRTLTYHLESVEYRKYMAFECVFCLWGAKKCIQGVPAEFGIDESNIEMLCVKLPLTPGWSFVRPIVSEIKGNWINAE